MRKYSKIYFIHFEVGWVVQPYVTHSGLIPGFTSSKEPRSGQSTNALTRHRAPTERYRVRPYAPLSGSPQGVHIAPTVSQLPCIIIFKLQHQKIRSLLRIVLRIGFSAKTVYSICSMYCTVSCTTKTHPKAELCYQLKVRCVMFDLCVNASNIKMLSR